jgi:DNA-binding GntR family transcriptional regulator
MMQLVAEVDESRTSAENAADTGYVRLRAAIREDIVAGRFQPGGRLKIPELCRIYEVSAIPVREALQQLQGEGLVVMVPNRGATVRAVNAKFIGDIYDIREAIDGFMARRFLEVAPAGAVDRLAAIQEELEELEGRGEWAARHEADRRFHRVIIGASRNEEAVLILERQNNIINALRVKFGQTEARRAQVRAEHRALIDAFREGDADLAGIIAARHARHAGIDLLSRMAETVPFGP